MTSGQLIILGLIILLVIVVTRSFTKHCLEAQLTHNWNNGDWAAFRLHKQIQNNPRMSIFEYCNQRLARYQYPNSGGMNCDCVQKYKKVVMWYNHVFRLED